MPNGRWIKIKGPEDLPEPVEGAEWRLRLSTTEEVWKDWHPEDWSDLEIFLRSRIIAYWSIPHFPRPYPTIPEYKESEA